MINGRYDYTFPVETSGRPMFSLFAAPEKDRKQIVFDTGHDVTVRWTDFVRVVLNWLDQYLGRVR